jgi:hypothetical protein
MMSLLLQLLLVLSLKTLTSSSQAC